MATLEWSEGEKGLSVELPERDNDHYWLLLKSCVELLLQTALEHGYMGEGVRRDAKVHVHMEALDLAALAEEAT